MDDFVLETDCAAGRLGDGGGVLAANRGRSGAARRGRGSGTAASMASMASIASQDDHGC